MRQPNCSSAMTLSRRIVYLDGVLNDIKDYFSEEDTIERSIQSIGKASRFAG